MMPKKVVLFTFQLANDSVSTVMSGLEDMYEFKVSNSRREAVQLSPSAEVLVMRAPMREVIETATNCRWIHVLGAGVDEYLAIERVRDGTSLVLTNSAEAYGTQVSEHVFALILSLTRGLKPAVLNQQDRRWADIHGTELALAEISGLTMAVLGLGDIGLEVAKRAKSFELVVVGVRRSQGPLRIPSYGQFLDEVVSISELDNAVAKADIVVNTLPLTADTSQLLDASRFSKFKHGTVFVNVGRGGTVVEEDLSDAIRSGIISSAGLDVFEVEPLPRNSPLWNFSNVVISPHWAGRSPSLLTKTLLILRDNLLRYSRGELLRNVIDKESGY